MVVNDLRHRLLGDEAASVLDDSQHLIAPAAERAATVRQSASNKR